MTDHALITNAELRETAARPNLFTLLSDDIAQTEAVMKSFLSARIPLIMMISDHLLSAGGKRLRPLVACAAAALCQDGVTAHTRSVGAAIEFIHTATLLHDDVVDESAKRRGKDAANLVWGNKAALLTGDFLFSQAFALIVETGLSDASRVIARAAGRIAEGEVFQLTLKNTVISEADYLKIISAKTAALFAASAEAGAISGGATADLQTSLRDFGENFGMCFQIIDDILDYKGNPEELGKNTGDDFREGKVTLPVIYAYREGNAEEKKFWQAVISEPDRRGSADFQTALTYIKQHNALEKSFQKAGEYNTLACAALKHLADLPVKHALAEMCRSSTERAR